MSTLLLIAALFGFAAIAFGLGRAIFATLGRLAEGFLAGEVAGTRARRGDLTGMAEAERQSKIARRERLRLTVGLLAWAALLVGPLFTPWPRPIYAAASVLWLAHR